MPKHLRLGVAGIHAANAVGLKLVEVEFDRHNWPCPALRQILSAMVETGVIPRMPYPSCVDHTSHVNHGHIQGAVTLEEKLGECVAGAIRKELQGTEFEWMTDLTRCHAPGGSQLL